MKYYTSLIAAAISTTLLAACSSSEDAGVIEPPDSTADERGLKSLENSEAFYDALGQALVSQSSGQSFTEGPVDSVDAVFSPQEGVANAESAPTESDSGDTSGSSVASGSDDSSGNEVTSTNVQELGVDEQDWVKVSSDGTTLYVMESSYSDVFIPQPMANSEELPTEGTGEMPEDMDTERPDVEPAGDELLSTSPAPYAQKTVLRIMALDAETPDSSALLELDIDLQGRTAEGAYLYESDSSKSVFITASGNNYWSYWGDSYAFGGVDSVIKEVDVTDPAAAAVKGSIRLDGQVVSSRRIGKHLFFASRYYPALPGEQPWNQTPQQVQEQVNNTDLSALLPQYRLGDTGEPVPMVDPGECFVAAQAGGNDYYSPDIITLGVIDLDTLQLTDSECYLGASETLYASPDAVFLATTQYDYSIQPVAENGVFIDVENGEFPADIAWYDPRVDTDIHQFDIEAGQLTYAGSGSVRGHLGWNWLRKPFRMSEKDGYLRVATFNDQQGSDQSPILMTVLQADGTGKLQTVSTLPNESEPGFIGKPGEQLYASRFLGDRAYLVTFRQTDPLYVIDLANPQAPRVAGELEIEGYSDYLHPIGEDYLLGIGKDAVAAPDGGWGDGRGALVQGVKMSLFNVSNPANPTEVQSLVIGQRGTHSSALEDHRAITVQAATDEHPTRVSIGIDVHGQTSPDVPVPANTAFDYYRWSYSGLHGFDINVGADAGIVPRGTLVTGKSDDRNEYYFYGERDRSVMVNDSLFYIRGSSVYAARWDDLSNPSPAR